MERLEQRRTADASLFPSPGDGTELGVNPDGFVWLPVDDADEYELLIRRCADGELVLRERTADHYYVPRQPFPPGEYRWSFRALSADGDALGRREPWAFEVPEDAPVAVPPTARAVLDDVADDHPRLVFPGPSLAAAREWIRDERAGALRTLRDVTEDAYDAGMPPAPEFHLRETEAEREQYYSEYFSELRDHVDRNLRACALLYLLDGDERAGAFAREMLLHVCGWNPEGPNSVEWVWGDEPGLSYARILPQAYDWTHDLYDDREREYVERTLARYCRQTYDRLRDREFTVNPTTSHEGRLPGYLGEMAILLRDRLEAGEAEEMLQYALDVFATFYPHWGGRDGGWAEGVAYGLAYNRWYVPFFATLERHTEFSFWEHPFFRRVKEFFVYCAPPGAEALPFGDGQEDGPRTNPRRANQIKSLLQFYRDRFDDPVAARRAAQFDGDGVDGFNLLEGFVYPPGGDVEGSVELPDARLFRDVGWAALHGDLGNPESDTYLAFRSSPYGNVSHSHNNQNAFCLSSGGHALAISSGYYDLYGSPHHAEWTRRTRAHNAVLVDGAGQDRGIDATGEISRFEDGERYTYLRGDAADAYGERLERFDRHVLFVRPGLFLIYDDLAAAEPVEFGWLLHTLTEPAVDGESGRIGVRRGPARMETSLFADGPLSVDVTDRFETPPNEGILPELREEYPDQYHVTATTDRRGSASILAVVTVGQGELPEARCERRGDEVRVEHPAFVGDVDFAAPAIAGETATGESLRFDFP